MLNDTVKAPTSGQKFPNLGVGEVCVSHPAGSRRLRTVPDALGFFKKLRRCINDKPRQRNGRKRTEVGEVCDIQTEGHIYGYPKPLNYRLGQVDFQRAVSCGATRNKRTFCEDCRLN